MKSQTLATVAALVATASATYDWSAASPFTCPTNSADKCTPSQSSGFSWGDLNLGSFSGYGGFGFSGFNCKSSFDGTQKRDELTKRTFQDKCITGHASSDKSSSPSFSAGSSVGSFSVDHFAVSVEFDCDLEFHYGMPNGGTCKQTKSCSKSGTIVKNTQCGGATSCTIIYPGGSKPQAPKPSCSIGIHTIGFNCDSTTVSKATSTKTKTPTTLATTTSHVKTTTTHSAKESSTTAHSSVHISSATPSSTLISKTSSFTSVTSIATSSLSSAVSSGTPVTSAIPTSSAEGSITTSVTSPPAVTETTTFVDITVTSCPVTLTHTTDGTTHLEVSTSISTIRSTRIHTICTACTKTKSTKTQTSLSTVVPTTSQEASVSSSIASSTFLTSVVVPTTSAGESVSSSVIISSVVPTTSAGESLTSSVVPTTSAEESVSSSIISSVVPTTSAEGSVSSSIVPTTSADESVSSSVVISSVVPTTSAEGSVISSVITSSVVPTTTGFPVITPPFSFNSSITSISPPSSTNTPGVPAEEAPCPEILPACLNTFMFTNQCSSNTDSDCYCQDASFVCTVFDCLSAHGASDKDIDDAQKYLQGICAPHVAVNPAIVTCAAPITPPAEAVTSTYTVPVTTVQVLTTIVVPCSTSGIEIPESSTTQVISTVITVPQVVFTTNTAAGTTSAALVVGTPAPAPATTPAGAITASLTAPGTPALPTIISPPSNGTIPSASATPSTVFSSSSSRTTMTFGSLLAAAVIAVFAL